MYFNRELTLPYLQATVAYPYRELILPYSLVDRGQGGDEETARQTGILRDIDLSDLRIR